MNCLLLVDRIIVGDGRTVLGPSTVHLIDGRIAQITPGKIKTAANLVVLDYGEDSTLLPGLIDTHVHLSIASGEYQLDLLRRTREDRALLAAHAARMLLQARGGGGIRFWGPSHVGHMQEGFTTLRSAGDADSEGVASFAVRDAVERGLLVGPRIVGAPHYISVTGGGGDLSFRGCPHLGHADGLVADGPEGMRLAVRRELKQAPADWIKILVTGAFMASSESPLDSPENTHFSPEELRAVVEEASRRGVSVMAHAHGARGIEAAALAGVRSIEHASFIDAAGIDACLKHGVWVVPTLLVGETLLGAGTPGQERATELQRKTKTRSVACLREAVRRGVKIAMGSDFVGYRPRETAREFQLMVDLLGMTPQAAICAGTLGAAQMLRLDDQIGSVEPGKVADLVCIKGNPLLDLSLLCTSVMAVFASGNLVSPTTSKL